MWARNLFLSLCLAFVIAGINVPSVNAKEVVKVCFLNWGKQGGKHLPEQGFNPDLVSHILREAGYEPKIDIIPWVRCLEEVKTLKYDFVAGYWIGGEYDEWYDYFLPTTVDRINFITTKETGITSGRLEDLYGKRIAILKGAGGLKSFWERQDKYKIYKASNDDAMIKMLKNGRIDAIISNSPHIISLAESSYPDWAEEIVTLQPAVQTNIAAPGIAVNNPRRVEMKERYNKAYLKLKSEGIYERLMKKHQIGVDFEMSPEDREIFDAAQR
jgi:polar amino acid transport system substrate-binding protein